MSIGCVQAGSGDVCWITQVGQGQWNRVLDMVSRIRGLGMEVGRLHQLHALPVHTACQTGAAPK